MLLVLPFTFEGQGGICVFSLLFHVCILLCEYVLLPVRVALFLVSNL